MQRLLRMLGALSQWCASSAPARPRTGVFRVRLGLLLLTGSLVWGEVPECNLAPGWQQSGPRRSYEGESLYEYMNGNSEGYLIYSFRKMTGVSCTKSGVTIDRKSVV